MSDRIATLHEKLQRLADARKLALSPVWDEAWTSFERELLERLLKCGPDDDWSRYRLQIAIESTRHIRRIIESASHGDEAGIAKELDILEGRRIAPIA